MGEESVLASYIVDFDNEYFNEDKNKSMKNMDIQNHKKELIKKYRSKILTEIKMRKSASNEMNSIKVVDKMLNNYRSIGLIHLLFPNSLFIHISRDPLDTLVSCYTKRFANPYLSYISSDHKILVAEYVNYLRIVHHFRNNLPNASDVILDIRYESLVANPRRELEKIMSLVNIPWDESVLQFYSSQRVVYTASKRQVNKPVFKSSVGHWKRYYDDLVTTFIEELHLYLPSLKSSKVLPFYDDLKHNLTHINWDMDKNYNYTDLIERLV